MWTRTELKTYAKGFLKNHYWKTFFAVLITLIIANVVSKYGVNFNINIDEFNQNSAFILGQQASSSISSEPFFVFFGGLLERFRSLAYFALGAITLSSIIISVGITLISLVIEVGLSRYFLDAFEGDVNINKVFFGFNSHDFWPILKTQLMVLIRIIAWSLLLFIPGIVKSYQYRYVSYFLAKDPTIVSKDALLKSKELTKGHKANIFILDVSFFFWNLLELVSLGLANYFIQPYKLATNARLFNVLLELQNSKV